MKDPKLIEFQKIDSDYPYRLLLQADETQDGIDEYLFDSEVYVAKLAGKEEPVGGMCLLSLDTDTVELMNIAVDEPFRGMGIGGVMIEKAVEIAATEGYREIILGTGTEDFFNTSWCPASKFYHPYYGYARVNHDIGFLGRTHAYRFFISDPIYFNKSLKGTIEHGHNNNLTLDVSSVTYWYQSAASPLPPAPPKEIRVPKKLNDGMEIHRWRHEWRKNMGNDSKLWGNEKMEDKK